MKRPSGPPCRQSPIKARRNKLIFRLALLAFLVPALAFAAPADSRRAELKELQGRIRTLQKDIGQAEGSRADAAEELRETESAISEANRKLRDLAGERGEVQAAIAALGSQSQRLEERVAAQQSRLIRLLNRQYRAGEADALRQLLAGNDPNQIARDAHYLALLSRAEAALIRELDETLLEKRRLTDLARARYDDLAQIEQRRERERAELLGQQRKRQTVLARISERIQAQRREVDRLKRDEKRLSKLIAGLGRIVARPKRRAETRPAGAAVLNTLTPEATGADAFARLKGRLRLPARGELANRFGTPRVEGGTLWKGLFIRAPAGGEVKAIAAGQVVFADWMRGFGNLLILDHGDGYLSVYGNNESLLRQVGEKVAGGEAVASIGNSGGNPETGLYFELRHLGQPLDPMKWVSLK